jgi:hypothetical protein
LKLLRFPQITARQVSGLYDQQAVVDERIVCDSDVSAIQRLTEDALQFGAALGRRIDNVCRYVISNRARLACSEDETCAGDPKCVECAHHYLPIILFCCHIDFGT